MASRSKFRRKVQNSNFVAVSMDSLLGVLASAYGTDQIDSNSIFSSDTVSWGNISVDNVRLQVRKENNEEDIGQIYSEKGLVKISVSTSTSNLKFFRRNGSQTDITLLSIKSLEDLNLDNSGTSHPKCNLSKTLLDIAADQSENESKHKEIKTSENNTGLSSTEMDNSEIEVNDKHHTVVETFCKKQTTFGFIVNSPDQKLVFSIEFKKKVRNIFLPLFDASDSDVVINVTEVGNQSKPSVELPKASIISKCAYIKEVDKEMGLEEYEINVTCNLNSFLWVTDWIKADTPMCKPKLCVGNLKEILLIAYHLKIDGLVQECLDFFQQNLECVLKTDGNIEHIFGEDLFLQFAKHIRNTDLNKITGEFEDFKTKLFCSLITLLADENICAKAGHYSTLATMFLCASCAKLLNIKIMNSVPCSTHNTQLDYKGELQYSHQCLPDWSLSKYIELLFEEFQSFELVYWYLWGACHFLSCNVCQTVYPVSQSDWCAYHPGDVEYFPLSSDRQHPIGSYTCCAERAYKFNVLQQYSGCKFKSHTPDLTSTETKEILRIYEANKTFISCRPNPPETGTKTFLKLVKKTETDKLCDKAASKFWWDGIQLCPKEKKDYSIISLGVMNRLRNKPLIVKIKPKYKPLSFVPQIHFGMMPTCSHFLEEKFSSLESTNNKPPLKDSKSTVRNVSTRRDKMKNKQPLSINQGNSESVWSRSLSDRENQENQRDFEDVAMARLVKMLAPVQTPEPMVGTYVRLEAEWWRDHCSDSKISGNPNSKTSCTVVNRTFPLSWFRRPPQ